MRPSLLNRTAPKGVVDTEHHSRWPLIFLQPKFEPYLAKFSKDFWANLAPTVGTYIGLQPAWMLGYGDWCGWRGSNPRPLASEANTLSTELQPQR